MSEIRLPEPLLTFTGGYTADQMKAAILEERERCAKICDQLEQRCFDMQKGDPDELANLMLRQIGVLGAGQCAEAIRSQ